MEAINSFIQTIPGSIIFLLLGFVLLIKGADFFVDGASAVAKKLRVPSVIVGMTIVAMGTSLPETSVSVTASIAGANGLAISNAIGSNIFNLMVVLGVAALFAPLVIDDVTLKRDFPISVICAVLLLILGWIGIKLGHFDGVIFLFCFIAFMILMVLSALKARNNTSEEEIAEKTLNTVLCIVFIIGGAIAIKFGGDFVVDSASNLAIKFGMSETLVGLTIVALGTSLPELVTSVVAAKKNELDMAIGNVVGSNIFNILMVVGIAAAISPIAFIKENIIDIIILCVFSLIVFVFCITRKRIAKGEGVAMLVMYIAYLVYIILR